MSNCPDLCTAAKCAELEARINSLENQLSTLYGEFIYHTQSKTSDAHDFDVAVTGLLKYDFNSGGVGMDVYLVRERDSNLLTTGRVISQSLPYVFEWDFNAHKAERIPVAHDYQPEFDLQFTPIPNGQRLSLVFESTTKTAVFNLDSYSPNIELRNYPESNSVRLVLSWDSQDISTLIDLSSYVNISNEPEPFSIGIEGFYENNGIYIGIAAGGNSDNTFISLPYSTGGGGTGGTTSEQELPPLTVTIDGEIDTTEQLLNLAISVAGNRASTAIDINTIMTNEIIDKIWAVLGGDDTWTYNSETKRVTLNIQPETDIKTTGRAQYSSETETGKNIEVGNLLQLITSLHSVSYYRAGYHRLPATTVSSLLNNQKGNQPLVIYDNLSFQEWILKNIDALVGEFPIKLKSINESGEQEIVLENLAETLTELIGLLITIAEDSGNNLNATIKAMIEARSAANAATVAVDYASATAEYLGYKGKNVERIVPVSFTPGATKMKDVLKPSQQKIIGWEMLGDETLVELVKRILVSSEIVKAALYIPWQPGQSLTGDSIGKDSKKNQEDKQQKWDEFITQVNTPNKNTQISKPQAKIKDRSID